MYAIVWSVVNDPFVENAAVEDQEGFEQQHAWEGLFCPITTCILITPLFTFCLH
jgi:predicted membrane protein